MRGGRTATLEMVREFHRVFNIPCLFKPRLNRRRMDIRLRLLREELKEVREATHVAYKAQQSPCQLAREPAWANLLQELCDLQYVLDGAFLEFGLVRYRGAAFREVHRANMSKLGADGKPIMRADGKVLKSPYFKPADVLKVLRSL